MIKAIVALVLAAIPLSLSYWQWQRLGEKKHYNNMLQERCEQASISIDEIHSLPLADLLGRKISFTGEAGSSTYLFHTQTPEKPLTVTAYDVDGVVIFVIHSLEAPSMINGRLLEGHNSSWLMGHKNNLWTAIELQSMGESLGYSNIFPMYILTDDAFASSSLCPLKRNHHLQYFWTWLSLSFLLLLMGIVWIKKRKK